MQKNHVDPLLLERNANYIKTVIEEVAQFIYIVFFREQKRVLSFFVG